MAKPDTVIPLSLIRNIWLRRLVIVLTFLPLATWIVWRCLCGFAGTLAGNLIFFAGTAAKTWRRDCPTYPASLER